MTIKQWEGNLNKTSTGHVPQKQNLHGKFQAIFQMIHRIWQYAAQTRYYREALCCLCFDTWLGTDWIYPYSSWLLHWYWGNHMIAPVPVNRPWQMWVNASQESIKHWCITTKTESMTKNPKNAKHNKTVKTQSTSKLQKYKARQNCKNTNTAKL